MYISFAGHNRVAGKIGEGGGNRHVILTRVGKEVGRSSFVIKLESVSIRVNITK